MAVFTELSDEDRDFITAAYGMTSLSSVIGIADGDTETTYLFRTGDGEFIVTLFENGAEPLDLERAFETMETLCSSGVPCPTPKRTIDGHATFQAAGRLVAVVGYVPGSSTANATADKCESLGRVMAQIHNTLERKSRKSSGDIPTGGIHGALIHENVFFLGDRVSGIINFRLRHDDALLSEVADALVAWTSEADGELDRVRAKALLNGYQEVRILTVAERRALPGYVLASASKRHVRQDQDRLPMLAVAAYDSMTLDLLG